MKQDEENELSLCEVWLEGLPRVWTIQAVSEVWRGSEPGLMDQRRLMQMAEMKLFGTSVEVYDTGGCSRKIRLETAVDALLWYMDQLSDSDLAEVRRMLNYESLSRSTLINSQTKVT